MEITVKEFPYGDVIALKGRLERSTVGQLAEALEACNARGRYKIIVDMDQLEYMSSAGFRALLSAQRNNRRRGYGELLLARVPPQIRQALELTGIGDFFKTFDDLPSAARFAAQLPGDPTTDAPLPDEDDDEEAQVS